MLNWRKEREAKQPWNPKKGEIPGKEPVIPATKFFDQLSFIGDEWVGCFVYETKNGIILIDCMEPKEKHKIVLEDGFRDLGLNMEDIKVILISHGHGDHFGYSDKLREKYGCKLYMSAIDEKYAQERKKHQLTFSMDGHLDGEGTFSFGGVDIKYYPTPGHTPGSTSFIIPVTDNGVAHKAALWGGSGIPMTEEEMKIYLHSCDYFMDIIKKEGADVDISSHPFLNNTKERLELCRKLTNNVPHPFVSNVDSIVTYHYQFRLDCLKKINEIKEENKKL